MGNTELMRDPIAAPGLTVTVDATMSAAALRYFAIDGIVATTIVSLLRGVEGLMLKHWESPYGSGRQRGAWWKWKIDPFVFDGVLLYAAPGHGRRSNLYTDYTFGVWQGDALVPVAKAYSGLTDLEIRESDKWIRAHTRERFGMVRSVESRHVFELAFEGIASSPRHKSGIALRFPRILRWRTDKPPAEADTLSDLQKVLAEEVRAPELCASCHTLITQARDATGRVIGSLPEQMPYQEWQHSAFRTERTCQSCHMPAVEGEIAVTRILGSPRLDARRHQFVGANFVMQKILGRYRDELDVAADSQELYDAADRTIRYLQRESAALTVSAPQLAARGRQRP